MLVAAQKFTMRDLTLRQSAGTGSLFWAGDSDGFDFTITADNIVVEHLNASDDNEIWGFGVGYGTTTRVTNSVFRGVHYALARVPRGQQPECRKFNLLGRLPSRRRDLQRRGFLCGLILRDAQCLRRGRVRCFNHE